MGITFTMISIRNPRLPDLPAVEVEALADIGANHLCMTQEISDQLRLEESDRKQVVVADGRQLSVPYVGPVELRFKNRVAYGGALVFGPQVLLGAIPMEDLDLVVIPGTRQIDVNPESPDIAVSLCMGVRI